MTALAPDSVSIRLHVRRPDHPSAVSPTCPNCHTIAGSKVTDTRQSGHDLRRRRECFGCGYRFTTYESVWKPQGLDFQI